MELPDRQGNVEGLFYPPPKRPRQKRGDELPFYAEHFDTVEVNSSFYRPPPPAMAKRWAERTPRGFEFAVKLYQKFTHPEMFAKATGKDPHSTSRCRRRRVRRGIAPLAEAGKLGPLVAQFPTSFRAEPDTREYLAWLLEAFQRLRARR